MAELEHLQALTLQVQQLTGAMVDMDKRHTLEIQQRDLQLAEMKGTLTALNTKGSRLGPGRSELLDPKILHKVQPFDGQRTSWKTFEFQWRANLIAQDRKYRELLERIDDPTKDVRNGDLDLENQELSMHAAVLCSGPCDAKREREEVDREERETRRRCCGMEIDSWRTCLNRAGKPSRHVVQVGRSSVPSGIRHCCRHQQDGT